MKEKKKFKLTIRKKLVITFVIMLLVPTMIVGTAAYLNSKNSIEKLLIKSAKDNIDTLNALISDTITPYLSDADYLSSTIKSNEYQGMESPIVRNQNHQCELVVCSAAESLCYRPWPKRPTERVSRLHHIHSLILKNFFISSYFSLL